MQSRLARKQRVIRDRSMVEAILIREDNVIGILARLKGTGLAALAVSVSLSGFVQPAWGLEDGLLKPIKESTKKIALETVATGLTAPNLGIPAPGIGGRLFVSDQNGFVWNIELANGGKGVFLDVSAYLVPLGVFGPGSFDERGLLGLAFHPDYASNGLLYTYTSEPVDGPADFSTMPTATQANHQSVVREWRAVDPTDPLSVVDPSSTRVLLRIDQPQFNHNAGSMNFGHDGMLYIMFGDGGGADDVDGQDFFGQPMVGHGDGNGQNPENPLGAFLRIDPLGSDSANGQYGVPQDNPFVGQPGFVDEIFAYGFRNPFRTSVDTATGDIYAGDNGQNDIEEVDVVVAGGNYGWNEKEGSFCFDPNGDEPGFAFPADPCPGASAGLIDPVAEYDHTDGISIIGGFVYRGHGIPGLVGRYVFGDFSQEFGQNNGRLFFLNKKNIVAKKKTKKSKIMEFQIAGQDGLGIALLGFGQDADGELYALGNMTSTPFGATGVVLKIVRRKH
jgi:glucose/arabinose dehydrogenase